MSAPEREFTAVSQMPAPGARTGMPRTVRRSERLH